LPSTPATAKEKKRKGVLVTALKPNDERRARVPRRAKRCRGGGGSKHRGLGREDNEERVLVPVLRIKFRFPYPVGRKGKVPFLRVSRVEKERLDQRKKEKDE